MLHKLKDIIEGKQEIATDMTEEQVRKWLEKENIDQAIRDFILVESCNGLLLHQYWQMNANSSEFFNHIFLAHLNIKQGIEFNKNEAIEKIKDFANALDKLFK
jgi:hypothetical protein